MPRNTFMRYPELRDLLQPVFAKTSGKAKGNLRHHVLRHFAEAGQPIVRQTLTMWVLGQAFPAAVSQTLLAEAIGGPVGVALMSMKGVRAYVVSPRGGPKHKEDGMSKQRQIFPQVRVRDGGGHERFLFRITCTKCSETDDFARTGRLDCEEYFSKRGWEVGNNRAHDLCPTCVGLKKPRLVASNGGPKPEPVLAAAPHDTREMAKEDGRLLMKEIEAVWDDHPGEERYRPGWSDQRLSEKLGVPVDWVASIRERDYGGSGEDPSITEYVREHQAVEEQLRLLKAGFADLEAGVLQAGRELVTVKAKLDEEAARYKTRLGQLTERVGQLGELSRRLSPPERKAAG